MEYIEFDIKQEIYQLAKDKIVEYSVEFDCEIYGSTLNKVYGSEIYYTDEVDGFIEVNADFTCLVREEIIGATIQEVSQRGSFKGTFNIDHKCFVEGSCEVRL